MFTKTHSGFIDMVLIVLLAGSLLLSGCITVVENPTAQPEPTDTLVPTDTVVPTLDTTLDIALDTGSLATGFQTEIVAARSASDNVPYWEILPEYTLVTLQGYPISNHTVKPQIFIFPVQELGSVSEGAGNIVASLQTLLQSPQEIPNMPFLPMSNSTQMMHANVQYLGFKSGSGLRYLTEFTQGIVPINNSELIYTYQGLSGDGKFYVAAVLPVTHPSLPADGTVTGNESVEFTSDFGTYVTNVVNSLNTHAADTFNPDLSQLDALLSSLEIK